MKDIEKVGNNLWIIDYRDEMPYFKKPLKCYIIWHHLKSDKIIIETIIKKVVFLGCKYFVIFGEYYDFVENIIKTLDVNKKFFIYCDSVNLRYISSLIYQDFNNEETNCYLIYDDYFLAQYVKEDIMSFNRNITKEIFDAVEVNGGVVEFVYNNSDCIISFIEDDYMIGYLGHELSFIIPEFAVNEHIFEDKTMIQIWDEVKDQFYK